MNHKYKDTAHIKWDPAYIRIIVDHLYKSISHQKSYIQANSNELHVAPLSTMCLTNESNIVYLCGHLTYPSINTSVSTRNWEIKTLPGYQLNVNITDSWCANKMALIVNVCYVGAGLISETCVYVHPLH